MTMKILIYLVYCISFYGRKIVVSGDNSGNCEVREISSYYWRNGYVNNGLISDNSHTINIIGSYEKLVLVETQGDYLTAKDTGFNSVEIKPQNFHELDKNTGTTPGDLTAISADFTFNCKDGNSTLTYMVVVIDYNQHAPKFEKEQYDIKIPKSISHNEDLSLFNDNIIVSDLDFSNKYVSFFIEPQGVFLCETEVLSNKRYRAIIKVENITNFDPRIVYKLKATDSGSYPGFLSSTVNLKGHLSNMAISLDLQVKLLILLIVAASSL